MKLRNRLFLWVGLIFLLVFAVSLFFENFSIDKNLKTAKDSLYQKIIELNEQRRTHIEEYLRVAFSEDLAEIDSLLLRIGRDPQFGALLFLDSPQILLSAPAHSAFLFKNDRWIDFIQTTKNKELTSLLIPSASSMKRSREIPIDDQISWILLDEDTEMKNPFIGINFTTTQDGERSLSFLMDEFIEKDWDLTALFDPEALLNFSLPPKEEKASFTNFFSSIQHAIDYLKNLKGTTNWIQKDILQKSQGNLLIPLQDQELCFKQEGEVLNRRIIQLLHRGDEAMMIAALASLFPEDKFGSTPFSPASPKGITRFPGTSHQGYAVLTQDVFFNKLLFDDTSYFAAHPAMEGCSGIGSATAVIASPHTGNVFIGNSLHLKNEKGEGYLTVGINANSLLEDLAVSTNLRAFLVHKEEIIAGLTKEGEPIEDPQKNLPFDPAMLKNTGGVIEFQGTKYYYLQLTPFKNIDIHFFLLDLEENAFALVNWVNTGVRAIIDSVSTNMRLIALVGLALVLILLHKVAANITKPITTLAKATERIAAGQLENIDFPSPPKGKNDEIAILCTSFAEMVIGLREKEKVKGVLNKVVSPEIASVILKGQIHLGGEERRVTVLFADIRSFTKMSAKKDPEEVIKLLNVCMTKVSQVIDQFGGVIDKYVGDEVMALFGAPLASETSALQAVESGREIVRVLEEWNRERTQKGEEPVTMGIGIHTGNVVVGNMGAENRLNYTVIGSNVNLAARLCSAAEGMEILISKETLSEPHVAEKIEVEKLPPKQLKGFDESFILYRVVGGKNAGRD